MFEDWQKRVLEFLLVGGIWLMVFTATVGPMIDDTLPGRQRPALADNEDYDTRGDLPTTVRGWAAVITSVPVLLAYFHLRGRFIGESASD